MNFRIGPIIRKGKYLTTAEIWFDEEVAPVADIILLRQSSIKRSDGRCQPFHTTIIKLDSNEADIFANFKKNTQYEIRRAQNKDNVEYQVIDVEEHIERFAESYDQFALSRGLSKVNRRFLLNLNQYGRLDLSVMMDADKSIITWHAYYRGLDRARLLYSVSNAKSEEDSAIRSYIGRVNRYHHWEDILRFRNDRYKIYDFGGWYIGESDDEKLKINKFKAEFGGVLEISFNCEVINSVKARLLYLARKMLGFGARR